METKIVFQDSPCVFSDILCVMSVYLAAYLYMLPVCACCQSVRVASALTLHAHPRSFLLYKNFVDLLFGLSYTLYLFSPFTSIINSYSYPFIPSNSIIL